MYHVRLTPYDKTKGALCRRFNIGGQLFREGEWYSMPPQHTILLRDLKQSSGCAYFQIVETDEEWKTIIREELAIAMAGPQAAVMAKVFGQMEHAKQNAPPVSTGERKKSIFDGIQATEVLNEEIGAIAAAVPQSYSNIVMTSDVTPETTAKKKKSPPRRSRKKKK